MIEVLKQAAEDVSKAYDVLAFAHTERALELLAKTRTSLRQAIREHAMYEVQRLGQEIEQEPVAWMREDATLRFADGKIFVVGQPFYTHPPQLEQNFCPRCGKRTNDIHTCTPPRRTWVGLDHHDKKKFSSWLDHKSDDEVFTAIEAKLKELNT